MNVRKPTNLLKDSVLAELIAAISLNEKSLPLALTRVALCELQERRKADADCAPVVSELFISGVRDEGGEFTAVDDATAQFWTVYRRNEDGTCDALMDFMNRESAEKAIHMIAPQPAQGAAAHMGGNLSSQTVEPWTMFVTPACPRVPSDRERVNGYNWLDWNQLNALGLIFRINNEILHPMGLAIFRDPKTGVSDGALIAPDDVFSYPQYMIDEAYKGRG